MTDKRLIEVAFPLKQTSLDSVHEKNVRHGHISTLHIWPARRPLAACRAALIATLLPDPGTPELRKALCEKIGGKIVKVVKRKKLPSGKVEDKVVEETVGGILHWGRETENKADVDWFREEIRKAYGSRAPKVLDPFAGGGAIPLEAMRLGCEVTAIDINPVAWFILKCTLEYPQKLAGQKRRLPDFALRDAEFMGEFFKAHGFKKAQIRTFLNDLDLTDTDFSPPLPGMTGQNVDSSFLEADLAWHVRAWGRWVLAGARKELACFYPTYADFQPLDKKDDTETRGVGDDTETRRHGDTETGTSPRHRVAESPRLVPLKEDGTADIDALNEEVLKAAFAKDKKFWGKDPDSKKHRKEQTEAFFKNKSNPRWVAKPTVAYLWARTVRCKNCRAVVPLLKTRWLAKKDNKRVVLTMEVVADAETRGRGDAATDDSPRHPVSASPGQPDRKVAFGVESNVPATGGNNAQKREHDRKVGAGTMSRAGAWCPCCGKAGTVAMEMEDIRQEGVNGRLGALMTAVVVDGPDGKEYRLPTAEELRIVEAASRRFSGVEDEETRRDAASTITEETIQRVFADVPFGVPDEPTPKGGGSGAGRAFSVQGYGMMRWRDLFTPRQLMALGTFVKATRAARAIMAGTPACASHADRAPGGPGSVPGGPGTAPGRGTDAETRGRGDAGSESLAVSPSHRVPASSPAPAVAGMPGLPAPAGGQAGGAAATYPAEWVEAMGAYLSIPIDKVAAFNCTVTRWFSHREGMCPVFSGYRLEIVWDHGEINPLSESTGAYGEVFDWLGRCIDGLLGALRCQLAQIGLGSAASITAVEPFDLVFTDPPYYDAIPYSDLMDFFYIWLRRSLAGMPPAFIAAFREPLAPKWDHQANDGELIDDCSRHNNDAAKSKQIYEDGMARVFQQCATVLKPEGRLVIVFANKQPDAWETLVSAIVRAGFIVDGSWPIQTEMGKRTRAIASAALASSVWLVCKKRVETARPGWDNTVLGEMRSRIGEQLRAFWDAGIRGPDFVWAATGPAMESYSKHPFVKKADRPGETMSVSEFLRAVRRIVVDFVVGRVLTGGDHGADSGGRGDAETQGHGEVAASPSHRVSASDFSIVNSLDDVTTYYLLHRHDFGMEDAPAGACILYAVSCNLSESDLADKYDLLVRSGGIERDENEDTGGDAGATDAEGEAEEGSGSTFKLKAWKQRKRPGMGGDALTRGRGDAEIDRSPRLPFSESPRQGAATPPKVVPLIDQVHRLMRLWKAGDQVKVDQYLEDRGLRRSELFKQLLQALIELSPEGSEERSVLESISNHVQARGVTRKEEPRLPYVEIVEAEQE
jgi:adenine-specific DNA methylase